MWQPEREQDPKIVSLLCWNILADSLLDATFTGTDIAKIEQIFDKKRMDKILEDISDIKCNLVMLQEVDEGSLIQEGLAALGYEVIV